MEFKHSLKRMHCGSGKFPDFGAIFLSNASTSKECLKKNLFGLPPSCSDFVRRVKAGMLLFLFEYEKRILHGVFEATSDGGTNIVPEAYSSSGRMFPAQVRIATLWHCRPITEHQFYDAIKENYFSPKKFNFGLSKNQVYKLLCLFNETRDTVPKSVCRIKNEKRKRCQLSLTTRSEVEDKFNLSAKRKRKVDSDIQSVASSGVVSSTSVCDAQDQSLPLEEEPEKSNSGSKSSIEKPKKLKSSSENITEDPDILGDFIALSTSDDSDIEQGESSFSEAGCFQKSVKSAAFEFPSHLSGEFVGLENSGHTIVLSMSKPVDTLNEEACGLKLAHVLDSKEHDGLYNSRHGLYSDKPTKKSNVFSRLGLASKGASTSAQTKHGKKMGKSLRKMSPQRDHHRGLDKSVHEILQELQRRHDKWGNSVEIPYFFEQQDESSVENNRITVFSRLS